jgi:hypothetical protein
MTISRNISVMAQGASSSGILAGGYGGLGASVVPTTAGNTVFTTDGTNWSSTQKIVRSTAVTLTNQTSVDFSSIPSWVKRITVAFYAAGTNSTSFKLIQLGTSGGVSSSGYNSTSAGVGATTTSSTAGFIICSNTASNALSGLYIFNNITGNVWIGSSVIKFGATVLSYSAGESLLSGTLTQVRVTTVNGTDFYNAGTINILYE